MPELPEVETLRRQLDKEYGGKRFKSIEVKTKKFVRQLHIGPKQIQRRHITPKAFSKELEGAKITSVDRHGKYLAFGLDNDMRLVFHLGMSGRLVKALKKRPPDKHTHVILHFTQGADVRFFDARRFGECWSATEEQWEEFVARMGIDALEPIPWQALGELFAARKAKMKPLLVDQDFIAGLGNIYSDEILFLSGLSWDRKSDSLTTNEVRRLSRAFGDVMQDAVKNRGTTLKDKGWADLYDEEGEHAPELNVYGREKEPCKRCRTPIRRVKVGQRSHFFCPQCQSVKVKRR